MAKRRPEKGEGHQIHRTGPEALNESQAEAAGPEFAWHFGRITRMSNFELSGGRGVTIIWDEGGCSSQQGGLTNEQWEIFKLSFQTSGRIAILSDGAGELWMYDYRFVEALR